MQNLTPLSPTLNSDRMRINMSAASYQELRTFAPLPLILFTKLFDSGTGVTGASAVADLRPYRVNKPVHVLKNKSELDQLIENFRQHGFSDPLYYEVWDIFNGSLAHIAVMPHASGDFFAVIRGLVWTDASPTKHSVEPKLVSVHQDGSMTVTEASKPGGLKYPDQIFVEQIGTDATVLDLLKAHGKHIKKIDKPLSRMLDEESVRRGAEYEHHLTADHLIKRGIFVPLTDHERAIVERSTIDGEFSEHSDVLAVAYLRQTKRSNLSTTLIIFGVSLAMFMFIETTSGPWTTALMLAAILFFHEAGHYVAMKVFGYKDVKMFFIPGLGAAVIGKSLAPVGWKHALVSLAGPLPGIALGLTLGIIALLQNNSLYREAAILLLALNTFNLAPVLPLDGGRFLHTVLFSRTPILDVMFHALAAFLLILIYIAFNSLVFLILAILMGLSLRITWRTAQIASDLKGKAITESTVFSPGVIHPSITGEIIARLRNSNESKANRATLAVYTMQIYERIASHPPSSLVSIGLLAIYIGSSCVGVIFSLLLIASAQGEITDLSSALQHLRRMYDEQPWSTLPTTHPVIWNGQKYTSTKPHTTIIAPYSSPTIAKDEFESLKSQIPATASVRLFGDKIFLLLPAADDTQRQILFDRMVKVAPKTIVKQQGAETTLSLQFNARTLEATSRLHETLRVYFTVCHLNVPAPWDPDDSRDLPTREKHSSAQKTYALLLEGKRASANESERKAFLEKRRLASRSGDTALVKRLFAEQMATIAKRDEENIEAVRKVPLANHLVIEAYMKNQKQLKRVREFTTESTSEELHEEMSDAIFPEFEAELIALVGGRSSESGHSQKPGWVGASTGDIHRENMIILMNYCGFEDIGHAAPALVEWLRSQGCQDFIFEIENSEFEDE